MAELLTSDGSREERMKHSFSKAEYYRIYIMVDKRLPEKSSRARFKTIKIAFLL